MLLDDLIEGTVNSIAMMFFFSGIIVAFLIFKRKKTATNLLLIILFTVGFFYSFGEVLEAFTTWYDAEEFSEFFTIFLSIIILLIGVTAFFEFRLRETEQKLYEQRIKAQW